MRSVEDKGCLNNEIPAAVVTPNTFEFHKPSRTPNHLTALGKPTPSKWDDAQKWLVNLSKGSERNQSKTKPRNSNADDRRLIAPVPKKEDYSSGEDEERRIAEENGFPTNSLIGYGIETKNVDCEESIWRINKPTSSAAAAAAVVRSICVRDMGTEMTPMVSQDPSRTATPIRALTPATRSPVSSPVRNTHQSNTNSVQTPVSDGESGRRVVGVIKDEQSGGEVKKVDSLENRAMAWDEAERAKYTARFKREEVKIQAWENHEKRKAEMEMKRIEGKAERMKSRAEEKLMNKLASTRRIAEEKRANAEAKLNEKAVRTSERADYIRRTGHLPSSLSISNSSSSFKLPSFCS